MTSYERMHLAMAHQKPDRVPVMCQLSLGYMEKHGGERPFDFYFNPESMARALMKTRRDLQFDGVLLNVTFAENWAETYRSAQIEQVDGAERYTLADGRVYEDRNQLLSLVYDPGRPPAPDIEDVDPDKVPLRLDYSNDMVLHRMVVEQGRREQVSVHGEIVSPLDCLCELLGLENALMAMVLDGEKCKVLLERYVAQCVAFAKAQIDVGVDAMKISSPYAGGSFISRPFYAQFVMPYEREVVRGIRAYAPHIPIYTHTCGFIGDRLELMAESGIDGLECMDPPPLGNTRLEDAKATVGDRLFLKGNLDSVNVLLKVTPETLEPFVREMLRCGAPGGGYILSTACSVAPGVDPAVLRQLAVLAEKYGRYDG
jgi:uroporphyrinogen-III decarboxylase